MLYLYNLMSFLNQENDKERLEEMSSILQHLLDFEEDLSIHQQFAEHSQEGSLLSKRFDP